MNFLLGVYLMGAFLSSLYYGFCEENIDKGIWASLFWPIVIPIKVIVGNK